MRAVIMAGGQGSRLKQISGELPKPMVPVLGKPILQYQIEHLKDCGIREITLVIGHLGEAIRSYFGDGSAFGVSISYFFEDHPMGTAGALYELKPQLSEDFLLLMGDLMLDVDFDRFAAFHRRCGGAATLFVHPNMHPYDSDVIVTDSSGMLSEYDEAHCSEAAFAARIDQALRTEKKEARTEGSCQNGIGSGLSCSEKSSAAQAAPKKNGSEPDSMDVRHSLVTGVLGKKEERRAFYHNQVNAGIYMLSPEALQSLPEPKRLSEIERELSRARDAAGGQISEEAEKAIRKSGKIDLDRDLIRPLIDARRVYAYRSSEYVKDMGTPDRYAAVAADLKNGIISSRNLKKKQKCIFLDRDGTINRLNGFIMRPEELELLPGAAEAIARINRSEYLCILVTNQPVVARGEVSFQELDCIHAKLETLLGKEGAYIDGLYYCPHHRDRGFAGEVPELKFSCGCRKPKPGLLRLAAAEHHIDLSASYMIGDSEQDVAAGRAAGTKTVLLSGSEESEQAEPIKQTKPIEQTEQTKQIEQAEQSILLQEENAPDLIFRDLLEAVGRILA